LGQRDIKQVAEGASHKFCENVEAIAKGRKLVYSRHGN